WRLTRRQCAAGTARVADVVGGANAVGDRGEPDPELEGEAAEAFQRAVAIFETDLEADRDAEARDVPFTDGFNQGADDAAAIRFLNDVNTGGDASVRFERAEFDGDDRAKHKGDAETADAAGIAVKRKIPPSPI